MYLLITVYGKEKYKLRGCRHFLVILNTKLGVLIILIKQLWLHLYLIPRTENLELRFPNDNDHFK